MSTAHVVEQNQLPATGTWTIDPGHAEVGFIGRHFGLTKVRGRFTGVEGTVTVREPLDMSEVHVVIDMASVSSGNQTRDDHLRSDDFFDAANHPQAVFRSTGVVAAGAEARMTGELTIKGVTRPLTLDAEYLGGATETLGAYRAVFSASGTINR